MNPEEDNVRIDPRLIRIGLQALEAVSDSVGVDFFAIDLEGKKAFLVDHGPTIMSQARRLAGHLSPYFENRIVALVENEGTAGLYFIKVRPKVNHG